MKIELAGKWGYRRMMMSSLPSILMMLITSVYSIVDGLFVSNFTSTTAFASLNLIWPAIMVTGAVGLMFGAGGSALVAMILGQGDKERASRNFTMIVKTLFITGIILAALFITFIRPVCRVLGATGPMIDYCVKYGRIVLLSLPLYMIQMAFHSFFMTAEIPQTGTKLTIICGITNIVLDALFIVVFGWGLMGAAIATAAGMAIGGIYPLYYFSSKKQNTTQLRFVKIRTDRHIIGRVCTNGLSEYVGNIALSIVSMCYNLQLMRIIGEQGVAVYGILMYIGFIYASVFIGFNIAISPVISYNYGAQNHTELKSLLRKSLLLLFVAGTVLTIVSEVLSTPMAGIFVGYDMQLKNLTAHAIRLYMLSFMICGLNMFVSAFFTALNNGIVSAAAAFTRTLVFELGSVFLLPVFLGLDGVWLAVDLADVLALLMSIILLTVFRSKYNY
ncbi:MAG: MATE family efflux transporter [Bacteroidaceae bacterium]|nr:MATE family efflux transporter [Bacteroidaceae bacterium]